MFGILCAIISGIAMSVQGVFNTRLGEKIGVWETTLLVQIIALIVSLIVFFFLKSNQPGQNSRVSTRQGQHLDSLMQPIRITGMGLGLRLKQQSH